MLIFLMECFSPIKVTRLSLIVKKYNRKSFLDTESKKGNRSGSTRNGLMEYICFLDMAYGSVREVEYQLSLVDRLGFSNREHV